MIRSLLRTLALVVSLAPVSIGAASFDPELAADRLATLETLLGAEQLSIERVQDSQRRVERIRNDALRCVRNGQVLIDELEQNLRLLGESSDQDPAEIIEQRTTFEVEIRRVEARVGACRLVDLHTRQLLETADALQRSLNTTRLTEHSRNGLGAIVAALASPLASLGAIWHRVADARLQTITSGRWAMALLAAALATLAGLGIRHNTMRWADQQRGRAGGPTVQVTLSRRAASYLPLILGGLAASIALWLNALPPRSEIVLVRVAVAVLAYGLGRMIVDWLTGPFSPGAPLLVKPEHAEVSRKRLHAALVGLLGGWLAFGNGWLIDVPQPGSFALRALVTIYLVAALLWVLRLGRAVPTLRNRVFVLRLLLMLAVILAVVTELTGYRNLANFLLLSVLMTLGGGLVLWTMIWAMRQGVQGIVSGTSSLSYRMRSWLGTRQEESSAELGWLYLVVSVGLWAAFLGYLIWVWDPTGSALSRLTEWMLEGFSVGDTRLVPKNVFIGLIAFGVIIAVTAWLKARLNKRWLRDMGMDRHARGALVTVSSYAGFALAVLIGLTLAGVSVAGMALVFGALSVGIGFGLQNIVNNFVSGLILLFERPLKTGDFVTVGNIEGYVREVRMRATEIETLERQNVIVPNSELVSTQVTNWVLRDLQGRLSLPIGVAYGSDTGKVREILEQVAAEHPEVITSGRAPAPQVLFNGFGDSSLDFELRVWIRHIEKRFRVISDINFAIDAAFREHGVVIPFPQRDLHVKTLPPDTPAAPDA